jgi:hypothetical protein
MHFTLHIKVNNDMEFHYYNNFLKIQSLKQLGFILQLNVPCN